MQFATRIEKSCWPLGRSGSYVRRIVAALTLSAARLLLLCRSQSCWAILTALGRSNICQSVIQESKNNGRCLSLISNGLLHGMRVWIFIRRNMHFGNVRMSHCVYRLRLGSWINGFHPVWAWEWLNWVMCCLSNGTTGRTVPSPCR